MRPPLRRRLPKYLPDDPFDRDRIILEHIFHKPFINNSLMRLLYQIFCLTAELSRSKFNDPHEFMRQKLEGSFVYSFYWMMYTHSTR